MNKNTDGCIGIRILSPLTGTAVPLEEVPDPVFSQKIIGDGVAILPQDGNLVSPIDAEVVSIAETLHAYGLRSENGIEVMIHFGLETVALKGECFQCCVKVGDKVKAGELLAKADLKALEEKQVNTITPVLICGGMEGRSMNAGRDRRSSDSRPPKSRRRPGGKCVFPHRHRGQENRKDPKIPDKF